jgi:hypothetical protein
VLDSVTVSGARSINVTWKPVVNASGYRVQYSPDPEFQMNVSTVTTGVAANAVTLRGLRENTIYNVRVQATGSSTGGVGSGAFIDSMFSPEMTATTGIGTDNEIATHLQTWLDDQQALLQNASQLVPELGDTVLSPSDRRRLLGSGVRRYGFIDKVSDTSVAYPQFWPDYTDNGDEQLKTIIREIEVLRNLLVFYESGARTIQDLLLIRGDAALRLANTYYVTVREASRRQVPDAAAVFQLLRLFWKRPRNASEEPTQRQTMRNIKGLLNGTREGEMFIGNESDNVTKGKRTIVDKTRKKPRGEVKVVEHEEVE